MKKIKSPWYGVTWIIIWTAGLIWFLASGMFDFKESVGLTLVWLVMVGITVYILVQNLRLRAATSRSSGPVSPPKPSLNALCPCGSGKKYKRCCGAERGRDE